MTTPAHRLGSTEVTLTDSGGAPITGPVAVEQVSHDFGFGNIGFELVAHANGEADDETLADAWLAVFNQATRSGYAAADLIVTTSKGVADDLVETFGVRRENIAVVPNPVDVEAVTHAAAQPIDPEFQSAWTRPVIVAAGRLAEAKNYPLLIDAIAELRKQIDVRLFILGTGELEPAIRERIRQRGLDASIILCGFQKNPWKYIGKADVFALSSRYEGFGNVLIEAMACGVPAVATASAGTRDIIRDGVDGVLVATHDAASLCKALATLLSDRAMRDRMSVAAVQGAERFALPRVVRLYDETLMGALA